MTPPVPSLGLKEQILSPELFIGTACNFFKLQKAGIDEVTVDNREISCGIQQEDQCDKK